MQVLELPLHRPENCQRTHAAQKHLSDSSPDGEFLLRAQLGDHAAFAQLVERYRPTLIRYCQGFLRDEHRAEDATQVAITRAWINITDCQGEFRPWLLKIAKNHGL